MPSITEATRYTPVQLAYKYIDPGIQADERTPLIFMHAVSCCKENWLDLPDIVASCTMRRAFALDLRNHGDSERSDIFNYDANVDDLLHFMDSHDIAKAILVGFSMGATVSYLTALRESHRVEKIFAVDMPAKKTSIELTISFVSAVGDAINCMQETYGETEAKKSFMKQLYQNLPYEIKYFGRQFYAEEMFHIIRTPDGKYSSKTCFEKIVKSVKESQFLHSDFSGTYDGPVTLVYGKLSHIDTLKYVEEMKMHFPNTKLIGIERATHTVQRDCPEEFRKILLQFLREEESIGLNNIGQNDYVDLQTHNEKSIKNYV